MKAYKKLEFFYLTLVVGGSFLAWTKTAYSEEPVQPATDTTAVQAAPAEPLKPFRTFIAFEKYQVDQNGRPNKPISNVRVEIEFPNEKKIALPGSGQYWAVGNGQTQNMDRVYELPYEVLVKDNFKVMVQMDRKGAWIKPCKIEVTELRNFNRTYICRTDVVWQRKRKVAEENLDIESIQIKVFTDLNTPTKEIPENPIALR